MSNFTLHVCAKFSHGEHRCASRCWCSPTRHTTPQTSVIVTLVTKQFPSSTMALHYLHTQQNCPLLFIHITNYFRKRTHPDKKLHRFHPLGSWTGLKTKGGWPKIRQQQVRTRRDGPNSQVLCQWVRSNRSWKRQQQLEDNWVVGPVVRKSRGKKMALSPIAVKRSVATTFWMLNNVK